MTKGKGRGGRAILSLRHPPGSKVAEAKPPGPSAPSHAINRNINGIGD